MPLGHLHVGMTSIQNGGYFWLIQNELKVAGITLISCEERTEDMSSYEHAE